MMEAIWSDRRIARQLDFSNGVGDSESERCNLHEDQGVRVSTRAIRRHLAQGHLGSRRPLSVLPLTPKHRRQSLEWSSTRRNWTAAEWNQVVFSDESRFNLCSDDNRVRVWRPRGERLNHAFAL
ncbi:transposable element Tcb1 transposase [Trichonephila clavipes]|nr:transposable element Tcb1 transposase [Trichonephila clavipes]